MATEKDTTTGHEWSGDTCVNCGTFDWLNGDRPCNPKIPAALQHCGWMIQWPTGQREFFDRTETGIPTKETHILASGPTKVFIIDRASPPLPQQGGGQTDAQIEEGLKLHHLAHDKPSQLSDAFRAGAKYMVRVAAISPQGGDAKPDFLGRALDLESLAKTVQSQTVQRAMEAGAHCLRLALAARAIGGGAKPIYMVSFVGLRGVSESGVWREASEEAFYTFAEKHRRIVFAAPASLGEEEADLVDNLISSRWLRYPAPAALGEAKAVAPMRGSHIKRTDFHGAGAYARCSYCGRYSDNPNSLNKDNLRCDCGKLRGWSGSFKPPTAESVWSGAAPVAEALPVAAEKPCDHANSVPHYDHSTCPDCGGFKTDGDREWGSGRHKWFANKEQAKFFAKNGFLPDGLQGSKP